MNSLLILVPIYGALFAVLVIALKKVTAEEERRRQVADRDWIPPRRT